MRVILNAVVALLLVAASVGLALWTSRPVAHGSSAREVLGEDHVIDASGVHVPAGDYRRIACCTSIACLVVPELVSSDRVILVTEGYDQHSPLAFRTAGRPTVSSLESVEAMLAARPDLVIVSNLSLRSDRIERLREQGLTVLDLGQMLGLRTLLPNIRAIGTVLGRRQRAEALATSLERRLRLVAAHVPTAQRKTALYLGTMGGSLMGGTGGTSFHDLLTAAGLIDAAAAKGFTGWPGYSVEEVLRLDPDRIVTHAGMRAELRATPGLEGLRALNDPHGVVELSEHFDSTGPLILDYAEQLCDAVYGPPPAGWCP